MPKMILKDVQIVICGNSKRSYEISRRVAIGLGVMWCTVDFKIRPWAGVREKLTYVQALQKAQQGQSFVLYYQDLPIDLPTAIKVLLQGKQYINSEKTFDYVVQTYPKTCVQVSDDIADLVRKHFKKNPAL